MKHLFLSLLLCSCSTLSAAQTALDVPQECAAVAEYVFAILDDAAIALAQSGGDRDALLERLGEIAEEYSDDVEPIACAVDIYVARKGGRSKLDETERAAYDLAQGWIERHRQ